MVAGYRLRACGVGVNAFGGSSLCLRSAAEPTGNALGASGFQLRLHTQSHTSKILACATSSWLDHHTSPSTIGCPCIEDSPRSHSHQDTQSHPLYSHARYTHTTRIPQCQMHEALLRAHSEVEDAEEEVAEEDAEEVL